MRRSLVQVVVVLVMAICVTIPAFEMIFHYHNSFLSGHDTIATLILVALCSAAAVPVVKAIFAVSSKFFTLQMCIVPTPAFYLPIPVHMEVTLSGPTPPLRI